MIWRKMYILFLIFEKKIYKQACTGVLKVKWCNSTLTR